MSDLKPLQLNLMKIPPRTVKEIIAEGFQERQWKREQRRAQRVVRERAYKARKKAAMAKTQTAGGVS